jgi:hypothetical protein
MSETHLLSQAISSSAENKIGCARKREGRRKGKRCKYLHNFSLGNHGRKSAIKTILKARLSQYEIKMTGGRLALIVLNIKNYQNKLKGVE